MLLRTFVITVFFAMLIIVPPNVFSQTSDRIVILDNLGTYQRGESLFVFGQIANVTPDAFLIMQIVNPQEQLCQIQQITPLANGIFLTDPISLSGSICGMEGDYDIKLFYGDNVKVSSFSVEGTTFVDPDESSLFDNGMALNREKIQSIANRTSQDLDNYTSRLDSARTLNSLEVLYVDLSDMFIADNDDAITEISPVFRPAVTTAIDSVKTLFESDKITLAISKQINRSIYSAIFNYEIGNTNKAILSINDAFVELKNVNPVKTPQTRQLTFSELEDTLLNLMKKTDTVMSSQVKEQVAFILARGTVTLFSDDISNLVDLLSKSRYLDVVSRKDTSLYRLVNSEWNQTKESLSAKTSIDELLESKQKVDDLHAAALLLRQLDSVNRFISSNEEENSDLINTLKPERDSLTSKLGLAASIRDILDAETEIQNMKKVLDISIRLSRSVEISESIGVNIDYVDEWRSLLDDVSNADSVEEILSIVSAFDASITEMRDKRTPLTSLKFEYEQLKQKAELQADHKNLVLINQALRIIKSAEQIKDGVTLISKIDRSEVLLTWASQVAPSIRSELENNFSDAYEANASDILQRVKSIENLADLGLSKNRFLPGFTDFVNSMNEKLGDVRDLVAQNDLNAADTAVRELFSEWKTVSDAYNDNPNGSNSGYSLDELQRIHYREQLEDYSNMVSTFYNSGFDQYSHGYNSMVSDVYELIAYGNFVDAEIKIKEIGEYLTENLPLKNKRVIFDISYDQERDIWTLEGAIDKQNYDRREKLYVTVYDINGDKHSYLQFTDTRQGDFFTQWSAPTRSGLYVVILEYGDLQASQIANIVDKTMRKPHAVEYDSLEISRDFEELQSFIERFGSNSKIENSRVGSAINEIKAALTNRDSEMASNKIDNLELMIERYLPVRSRSAVIETQYYGSTLLLSGAVEKTIEFREDLFVDIFDQRGDLVRSVTLKDNTSGIFSETLSIPFDSGVHVAQLEYHDLTVTDFFTVP